MRISKLIGAAAAIACLCFGVAVASAQTSSEIILEFDPQVSTVVQLDADIMITQNDDQFIFESAMMSNTSDERNLTQHELERLKSGNLVTTNKMLTTNLIEHKPDINTDVGWAA